MTPPTKSTVSLRQRALELLSKREYSEKELGQKLNRLALQYALDAEEIPQILADFKQRHWLSDARFAEQIVHARQRKFGRARVEHELREKGVEETLIEEAIEALDANETERARVVWQKKFKAPPHGREEWAKQARFLQSRGFGFDVIKQVLNTVHENAHEEE